MYDPKYPEARGFVCGNPTLAHLPLFFEEKLKYSSTHIFTGMKGEEILPLPGQQTLTQANGAGYLTLKELAQLFHPYLVKNPRSIIPSHPSHHRSYSTYHAKAMFFYNLQGRIFDNAFDFGQINYQNMFIVHLRYSVEILEIANKERQSPNLDDINKYKVG